MTGTEYVRAVDKIEQIWLEVLVCGVAATAEFLTRDCPLQSLPVENLASDKLRCESGSLLINPVVSAVTEVGSIYHPCLHLSIRLILRTPSLAPLPI